MLPSGGILQHTNLFFSFEGFVGYAGLRSKEARLVLKYLISMSMPPSVTWTAT